MKRLTAVALVLACVFGLMGCAAPTPEWDSPPTIMLFGGEYVSPFPPVESLPEEYCYLRDLTEEEANDTGLEGCALYVIPEMDSLSSFFLYQECGTVVAEGMVDETQRQWAYVQWTRADLLVPEGELYLTPGETDAPEQVSYDIQVDDTVQTLRLRVYELSDGAWELRAELEQAFTGPEGRIALEFGELAEGLRLEVETGRSGERVARELALDGEASGLGRATALAGRTGITYENEIPLAVQIVTAREEIHSYDVEYFEFPEEYGKFGYEQVYAVTAEFSQQVLG